MKVRDIIGAALTGASIVWVMFMISHTEGYVWFAPYIQTQFARDFSLDGFEKVQIGMNREEVRALIGDPLSFMGYGLQPYDPSRSDYGLPLCVYYTDDNGGFVPWDLGWVWMSLCYDDEGKVNEIDTHISTN